MYICFLQLASSVEILADNVNIMNVGSSPEISCTLYRLCTHCTSAHNGCIWLIEKQICHYPNQIVYGKFIVDRKESCPAYAITYDNNSIQVTVSNIEEKTVYNFFNKSKNISCEIENVTYRASIDKGVITCNWVEKKIILTEEQRKTKNNSLYIFYFSIIVDNVQMQFDNPRDHYISYYGGRSCPNKKCTTIFWESDSRKYYCIWCLKNDSCQITGEELNSCDVRNSITNEKLKDGALPSTIEGKSPDLTIESFKPDVLLYSRNTSTVMSITVKNHRILAEGRLITVTLAGQSCDEPVTVDDQTVHCIVNPLKEVGEGPVVIEYSRKTSVVRLKSVQEFRFVEPSFTGVSPSCVPATGGTRIELTGEYLNAMPNVQVFFRNKKTKVMCEIVELEHDRIGCVTNAHTDGPMSGPLQIVFDGDDVKFYKKKMFTYVSEPTISDGQVFEGVASGDIPFTVLGVFQCTEKQEMYVDYNEQRYYGHCTLNSTNGTGAMECWPPKLDCPDQVKSLPLGFRVDLAGKVIHLQKQTSYSYLLHPDPIYTDFEVFNGTVVRVDGVFPSLLQRRLPNGSYIIEVTFRGDEADDDERFDMINVTENYIECRSPFDTSVADILEIAVTVGKQVNRTVVQRRHRMYYVIARSLTPQVVIGGISVVLLCVFALIICVRKIMNSSKKLTEQRYIVELRNITAGIDDTTDYLLDSNTIKRSKTRR